MSAAARAEALAAQTLNHARTLMRRARVRVEDRAAALPLATEPITWRIDHGFHFAGSIHVAGAVGGAERLVQRVQLIGANGSFLATAVNGARTSPFEFDLRAPALASGSIDQVSLRAVLDDGTRAEHDRFTDNAMTADPYHLLTRRFFEHCVETGRATGGRVLEIGSRARSGHVRRQMVQPMEYIGLDIVAGDNTDLVGDAHELSSLVPRASIDAVFAISTFEHLAMPWKAVIEINHVLRPGGVVLIASHQAFPLHDMPWDFWRFSTSAWQALFNPGTGFRIIDTAVGEPAMIVAKFEHAVTQGLSDEPAYIASAVMAEKIADTQLEWPVTTSAVTDSAYPV